MSLNAALAQSVQIKSAQSEAGLKNSIFSTMATICRNREIFKPEFFAQGHLSEENGAGALPIDRFNPSVVRKAEREEKGAVDQLSTWIETIAGAHINRQDLEVFVFGIHDSHGNFLEGYEFSIKYNKAKASSDTELHKQLESVVRMLRSYFNEPAVDVASYVMKMYLRPDPFEFVDEDEESKQTSAIPDSAFHLVSEDAEAAKGMDEINIGQIILPFHTLSIRAMINSAPGDAEPAAGDGKRRKTSHAATSRASPVDGDESPVATSPTPPARGGGRRLRFKESPAHEYAVARRRA